MDGRELLARVVAIAKWLVYCGAVAVVGGAIVFVLAAAWLGIPMREAVRETPVSDAVSPSMVAIGVLIAAVVIVLDADLRS